jgi:hypothetical protein
MTIRVPDTKAQAERLARADIPYTATAEGLLCISPETAFGLAIFFEDGKTAQGR